MAEGARLALNNARDMLVAATAVSPALSAALLTLAEEEIGKAFLIAEAVDLGSDDSSTSWASCKRSFRDHRAKLIAYELWTDTFSLGPDPGIYCDTEDGIILEHGPMPHGDAADMGHRLRMGCLYVDWDDQYDRWTLPEPLAGHSITLEHLLAVIDSYSQALEVLLEEH